MTGCSIQTAVQPISYSTPISEICILENPKVIVSDVLPVIQENISKHGLRSNLYHEIPKSCTHVLEYVAYQRWDMTTFMSEANIKLYQENKLIGSVDYKTPTGLFGAGGINPAKWESTKSKLDPLLDELFKNYSSKTLKTSAINPERVQTAAPIVTPENNISENKTAAPMAFTTKAVEKPKTTSATVINSKLIEKIQTALKADHYYHGAISGELNEDTRNAIAVYKEINNLSGKSIDKAFLNALGIE
jgi:hypothetical protein